MYKIVLRKSIFSGKTESTSTHKAELIKSVSLPFPPFPELRISSDAGFWVTVKTVTWSTDDQTFECACSKEFMDTERPEDDFHDFDQFARLRAKGWDNSFIMKN